MGENKKEITMKFSLLKIMIFGKFLDACTLHQCTNCEGWHYEKLPNHHLRLACKYVRQCCIRKYHFHAKPNTYAIFRFEKESIYEEPDYSSEDHSQIQDDYEYDLDHFFFDDEKQSTTLSTTSSTAMSTTTSTTIKECNEYHGCVHVTESAYAKVGSQIIDF